MTRIIFFILLLLKLDVLYAAESFYIHEPIIVDAGVSEESDSLRTYFSDSSVFNYYEDQSLGAAPSVFLYGLDQRYVNFKMNGFDLTDPSTPLGVINASQISGLRGVEVERYKTDSSLNLKTKASESPSQLRLSGTHLGEHSIFISLNEENLNLKAGVSRAGGFNQTSLGDEKDWTKDKFIAFDYSEKFNDLEWSTHIFYNRQEQDYDSLFESIEDAIAKSEFLLFGQKIKLGDFKLQLSHTRSKRVFDELGNVLSFKGDRLQAEAFYKTWISTSYYTESNNEIEDHLFSFNVKPFNDLSLKFLHSKLRGEFFDFEYNPIEELGFFYKEIQASLFQINFDPDINLKKQKAFGLKAHEKLKFRKLEIFLDSLFQKSFDQVEFSPAEFNFVNFEEAEVLFASMVLKYLSYKFYAQGQRAKNTVLNVDLPRRPKWVFGFDYEKDFKGLSLDLGLNWNSSMRAFDGGKLSSFWTSDLGIEYKGFRFVVKNVLNQKKQIFRDFKRRPTTFELQYGYEF